MTASKRPFTTMFLMVSVDGKISTGDTDALDVDKDYPNVPGLHEGLEQYYELERTTDLVSLNTGRVFAKLGFNEKSDTPAKTEVTFVVIDSKPHLTESGVSYLSKMSRTLVIATSYNVHPARSLTESHDNIHLLEYPSEIDFSDLFDRLRQEFGAERLTVQSGGTLNTKLVRNGLIDRVLIMVAPALIGGSNTSTMMDGRSLHAADELGQIKTLQLVQAKPLDNSYLLLEYTVNN